MKKNVSLLAFTVLALLASCSSEVVDSNPNFPSDGVIRVTTGVGDLATRAGQDGTNLTLFNLSVSYPESPDYSQYGCMKRVSDNWGSYNAENDGITELVMKFKDATTHMFVTALGVNNKNRSKSAFITSSSVDSVLTDQSKADSVVASDILYMPKTEVNPKDSPLFVGGKLKLNLDHRLSKLKIVMTLGADFNPAVLNIEDIKDIKVNGLKTKFTWTPSAEETLTLVDKSLNSITPYGKLDISGPNKVATYECIVVPQDVDQTAFSVSFIINSKHYQVTLPVARTLEKKTEYTMPITVNSEVRVSAKLSASCWQ